jgi:predicted lipoprotein
VRRIHQQKIEEVIGESAGRERVRRGESWRSARSIRNIRMNLTALENFFTGSADSDFQLYNVLRADDVEVISANFDSLLEVLDEMPDALGVVLAQDDGREQIQDVADKLDALFESLEAGLKNTDLYLGFNSLDGD